MSKTESTFSWTVYEADKLTQREIYGIVLKDLGAQYPEIVGLSADLAKSTKIGTFGDAYPDRFFNFGIAEQNMFGVAAGLAQAGLIPFVPSQGSVGASGDLAPLSHMTLALMGEGEFVVDGQRRPAADVLQAKGIAPDIIVEETANGCSGPRLREADLERHLENDKDKEPAPAAKPQSKAPATKGKPTKDEPEDEDKPRFEIASKNDYQLNQAVNLLKGLQIMQPK